MNIITGYRGEPHITEQQDRDINRGIFGDDVCIINIGSQMAATIISATEIQIADGHMVAEGCAAEVPYGTVESLEIENGTQGMLRTDLIVARYTRDVGTGVEDVQLAVITGTPAASSPATPAYETGSIAAGDSIVEFPLYRVNLNGITISSVTRLATKSTIQKLVDKIGNTAMGTSATAMAADDFYVNGTQYYDNQNYSDILDDGGSLSFDAATYTLTMNNCTGVKDIDFAKEAGGIDYAVETMRRLRDEANDVLSPYSPHETVDQFREIFDYVIERKL